MNHRGGLVPDLSRDEKVKLIAAVVRLRPAEAASRVVRGQYRAGPAQPAYRNEPKVNPQSNVETYVALKLYIDNWRWAGVPIYLRTGKCLPISASEVRVQFKPTPNVLFAAQCGPQLDTNALTLRLQPNEGISLRFTGKDSEAQDLTQDVFLRVFKSVKSFRAGEGSFAVWLTRLTRNLLIDNYRRTKMERATDSIEDQLLVLEGRSAVGSRTDSILAGREASEVLQGALAKLSPELRETVILRDLEELEYREIAQVLGIPEGTVKSRLNRGRAELARILRRQKVLV